MLMQNHRFRTKLILGFAVVISFSVLITVIALVQLNQIKKNTELIYKHPLAVSNAVRDINISINGMHRSMKDVLLAKNIEQVDSAIAKLSLYKKEALAAFDIVFDRFLGDIKDVENAYNAFLDSEKIRAEVIELKLEGKDKEAAIVINKKGEKHVRELLEKTKIMTDFARNKADEFKAESENTYDQTFKFLLFAIISIIILSITMALIISRSILTPIKKFVSNIRTLYQQGSGAYTESAFETEEDLLFVTVSELKNAYKQIEDANHELKVLNEGLDEKVKIRTAELEKNQKELKVKNEEYATINEEYVSINEDLNLTNEELNSAKEKVEKSEQRFSMLMQQSPSVIEIYDLNGFQIEVNKAYEKLWGFPASHTLNKFNILKSKEVKDSGLLKYINRAYKGETVSVPEYEYDPRGETEAQGAGRVRWLSTRIYPLKDSSGQVNNIVITHEDITDRKQAEEALSLSNRHYQTLFENSPIPLWEEDFSDLYDYLEGQKKKGITDFDAYFEKNPDELKVCAQLIKIIDVNQATLKLHKAKNKQELLGNLDKIFTQKSFEVFKNEILMIANGGLEFEAEGEAKTLTGESRQIFLRLIIDKEQTGLKRAILATTDITKRKQTEVALRESEKEYRTLVDNIPGVTYRCTSDKYYTMQFLSDEIKKLTGYPGSEFINNNVRSFLSIIFPDDIQLVQDAVEEGVSEMKPYTIEYRIVHAEGEIRWVFEKGQGIFDSKDKLRYLEGVIIDITERKRAEEVQKGLFNISNAVSTTDNLEELIGRIRQELGTIIDTTNFYIALYDHETNIFTLPFFSDEKDKEVPVFSGKSLAKCVIETQKSLLANIDLKKKLVEEGRIDPAGSLSKIWLGVPLKIEKEVIGVLAVQSYTDEFAFDESDMEVLEFISDQISITIDRKKTEEELISALKKAEESDRLKTSFLMNMSHEIRTPMNGVIGFANLLKKPDLNKEKSDHYTNIIIDSSKQLLNIVNDILDISKIETGQMNLSEEEVSLNSILKEIYSFFKIKADEKALGLNLIFDLSVENSNIIVDVSKLKQIIFNLIGNALKFTDNGKIDFGYTIRGSQLEFFVKDSGIGISKKYHKDIFNRFSKVENNSAKLFGGTGLGLAICTGLVKKMGGDIWIESGKDNLSTGKAGGSEFYFTIPCEIVTNKDLPNVQKKMTERELADFTILIVEDEENNIAYLGEILSNRKIKQLYAGDGKAAIKIVKENPTIDLILMDIKLPIMDGYTATKEIKKINPQIPIIAQTAYALAHDREKAIKAGCNDYLAKPIDEEKLISLLNKYLVD